MLILALAGWGAGGGWLVAQPVHLGILQPGGIPGLPVMNSISQLTNGIQLTWYGPSGYYQLFQKANSLEASWAAVGKASLAGTATVPQLYSNGFFRVSGPAAHYAGSQACAECHGNLQATVLKTPHALAFTDASFAAAGGQTNPSCLACHTVGYKVPTGFVSKSATPQLANVQCENCHGPAANHAANPNDPTVIPRVEIAATMCGGCHSGAMQPTYEQWSASGHATVVPGALQSMNSSTSNLSGCGRCHSGSVRLALVNGQNPNSLTNDANVAITCVVCHNPHARTAWQNVLNGVITFTNTLTGNATVITNNALGPFYTNQLLCALASTNDFVLTTSATFSNVYNPKINVCAQCHNDRGAAWTDTARAPHHSPQYNMLLGSVGELAAGPSSGLPATHSRLEMQCVACHMPATNNLSSHTFAVTSYQLCVKCHTDPAGLVQFATNSIAAQIRQTKSYLDYWATMAAPPELQKYGVYAWEYTTPGDLSPGGSGPSQADQALIPDEIKKARFDLYLVLYDGSYGVHNGPYDIQLLQAANYWVLGQLYQ